MFSNIFQGKRVLVTGHTGFKGSWLTLWLHTMGADLTCISLANSDVDSHWNLLDLAVDEYLLDIRDGHAISNIIKVKKPEIIFHLAAQSLVKRSYIEPSETWTTNIIGTVNILDAARHIQSVKAIVIVTTDKCYENNELLRGYKENDRLGGYDPYSASKACAELVASSYRRSYFNTDHTVTLIATARAGNVIGGGDWSDDRLIPDIIRSIQYRKPLEIRSPDSTRPWQHVLDCLSGYLLLGQVLLEGKREFADSWNFGPTKNDNIDVINILNRVKSQWNLLTWNIVLQKELHESKMLYLDSGKARALLNWQPLWTVDNALNYTISWYKDWLNAGQITSRQQLNQYLQQSRMRQLSWVKD